MVVHLTTVLTLVALVLVQLLAVVTKVSNFSKVVTLYACFGFMLCRFSLL